MNPVDAYHCHFTCCVGATCIVCLQLLGQEVPLGLRIHPPVVAWFVDLCEQMVRLERRSGSSAAVY